MILGAIARGPMTGYELATYFEKRIGHYWSAHLSQIYPELARLTRLELLVFEVVLQEGRPTKKVYRITAAGKKALREWLEKPISEPPARSELLVKTHAVWLAPGDSVSIYEAELEHVEADLAHFDEVLARYAKKHRGKIPPTDSPDFADVANLRFGLTAMQQRAAWLRWIIRALGRRRSRKM